ncbi:MAG: hypothetical protein AB1485_05605 [Candidatus Thermoplasmatota archaeon]
MDVRREFKVVGEVEVVKIEESKEEEGLTERIETLRAAQEVTKDSFNMLLAYV